MNEVNAWVTAFKDFLKANQFDDDPSNVNILKLQSFIHWLVKQYDQQETILTVETMLNNFMNSFPVLLSFSNSQFTRYLNHLELLGVLNKLKHGTYRINPAVHTFYELIHEFIKQEQFHVLATKITYYVPIDLLALLTPRHVEYIARKNFNFLLVKSIIESAEDSLVIAFKKEILCSSYEIAKALLNAYHNGISLEIMILDYKQSPFTIKEAHLFGRKLLSIQDCLEAYITKNLFVSRILVKEISEAPINILMKDENMYIMFNHFFENLNPDNYLLQVTSASGKHVIHEYIEKLKKLRASQYPP